MHESQRTQYWVNNKISKTSGQISDIIKLKICVNQFKICETHIQTPLLWQFKILKLVFKIITFLDKIYYRNFFILSNLFIINYLHVWICIISVYIHIQFVYKEENLQVQNHDLVIFLEMIWNSRARTYQLGSMNLDEIVYPILSCTFRPRCTHQSMVLWFF